MLSQKPAKSSLKKMKVAKVAKIAKVPKKAAVTKTTKRSIATHKSALATAFSQQMISNMSLTTPSKFTKISKLNRKFSTSTAPSQEQEAEDPNYDEVQRIHQAFTPEQKTEYNQWLSAKLAPVLKQSFYASLAISGLAPAQPEMPDDAFMSQDLLETLTQHQLLIPIDSKVPIPDNAYDEGQGNEILDDLMHVLTTFKVIPADQLSKFKKGYINPKIEFDESHTTNPFDQSLEIHQTQEEFDTYGPLYTVGDALDNCLKMSGFYDVQMFQLDETDADLQLPPRAHGENSKTSFKLKKVELFPFHEDPANVFVREADNFYEEYLAREDDLSQLMDYHDQFFRYDVSTTLHEEVQEAYDRVMNQIEELEKGPGAQIQFADEDVAIFKGLIRDFYLQTSLYQNYLSDPDPEFPYYNINMDFAAQLKQLDQQQQEDDQADDEFVNDKKKM